MGIWANTVTLPAFLKTPEDKYYFYELIFLIPVFLLTWLLASAIAHVFIKSFGGKGSFDVILAGFGISISVSIYPTPFQTTFKVYYGFLASFPLMSI